VQKEILAKYPNANLRVYAVWFSMLPTDARSRWGWTGGILDDPRVVNYWDEGKVVGRWYAQHDPENSDGGIIWDAYYLYGPDVEWTEKPPPPVIIGATVREKADELRTAIAPLLR
jgi:hypothetical protein